MIVVAAILFWILTEAYRDATDIKAGNYIYSHNTRSFNRASVIFLAGFYNPVLFILIPCMFWSFFDFILNKMRNLPFLYQGSVADTDQMNIYVWVGSKIVTLIITICILLY